MERALDRVRAGEADPPCRTCSGILKSATISFGQSLVAEDLMRAEKAAGGCDMFLALGTTLTVYPVAYLPQRFREFDDFRVLVFGLALVVLATVRPEGLFPPRRTVRAKQLEHELEELEVGTDGEEKARA